MVDGVLVSKTRRHGGALHRLWAAAQSRLYSERKVIKRICIALLLTLAFSVHGESRPAEVLLFGVFHFANPGRDLVRVDQVDVSTPKNQAYLAGLAQRLCDFRPTTILLEFDRAREPEMRKQFDDYRSGKMKLGLNENHQIGFRVAEACGVEKLYGFDESEIGWNAEPLFNYLAKFAPEGLEAFNTEVARFQAAEAAAHRALSLRELLIRANDSEQDRINKDLYLLTNAAGAGLSFEGADATARWWHRNFRMYANIQRYATPGQRVLVVAGHGHTAILRDLLKIDRRVIARDVHQYLSESAPPNPAVHRTLRDKAAQRR